MRRLKFEQTYVGSSGLVEVPICPHGTGSSNILTIGTCLHALRKRQTTYTIRLYVYT